MIFCIQEGLLIESFDDQMLVFQVDNNLPYILNGVAAFILRNTDGKKNKEEIAEKICMKFDVVFHQALEDIEQIYEEFKQKNLIVRVG
jgi:methyltransferase-like protein